MRLLPTVLFCLCIPAFAAPAAPPEAWFLFDDVLSLKRAEEVVKITVEEFWGNAKLPDGQLITPKDEAERSAAPIARMDALYFAQAAQLAGLAEWCGLDPLPYVKHALNPAWGKYRDIKQIIFASMLVGTVAKDIELRKSARGKCSASERETTAKTIKFVIEKSNPAVQGTLRDQAAQRP